MKLVNPYFARGLYPQMNWVKLPGFPRCFPGGNQEITALKPSVFPLDGGMQILWVGVNP